MYNSGTLNTFTKYCFQNLLIIPTETLYPLNYISPAPPATPHPPTHFLGACVLLSISTNAPSLGLSYTWTHKVLACFLCGLFHLGDVFKVHLCIRVSFLCKLCVMDRAEALNSELSLASSLPPGSCGGGVEPNTPGRTGTARFPLSPIVLGASGNLSSPAFLLILLSILVRCRHPCGSGPTSLSPTPVCFRWERFC